MVERKLAVYSCSCVYCLVLPFSLRYVLHNFSSLLASLNPRSESCGVRKVGLLLAGFSFPVTCELGCQLPGCSECYDPDAVKQDSPLDGTAVSTHGYERSTANPRSSSSHSNTRHDRSALRAGEINRCTISTSMATMTSVHSSISFKEDHGRVLLSWSSFLKNTQILKHRDN
jgi:hypothetical protein